MFFFRRFSLCVPRFPEVFRVFDLGFHGFTVLNSPQKGLVVPLKAGATVIHQGFTLGIIAARLLL